MPRKRYYEDYSEFLTKGEFVRLMDAVNNGVILESIAFSRQNLNMYKYQPGEVDRLIRTWSGRSYQDPFADREISISWDMFAQIVDEAAQQMCSFLNQFMAAAAASFASCIISPTA